MEKTRLAKREKHKHHQLIIKIKIEFGNSLDHSPARKSTRVTTTHENPLSLTRLDVVTTRHSQFDILSKVLEIVNSLLNGVQLEAIVVQAGVGVRETVETVFENDGSTALLLGKLTVDSPVCEVTRVAYATQQLWLV